MFAVEDTVMMCRLSNLWKKNWILRYQKQIHQQTSNGWIALMTCRSYPIGMTDFHLLMRMLLLLLLLLLWSRSSKLCRIEIQTSIRTWHDRRWRCQMGHMRSRTTSWRIVHIFFSERKSYIADNHTTQKINAYIVCPSVCLSVQVNQNAARSRPIRNHRDRDRCVWWSFSF
jgi:hypothetical protein